MSRVAERERPSLNPLQRGDAPHDPVSGLPSAASFGLSLRSMLERTGAHGGEVAVLWLDLLNLRREFCADGVDGALRLIRTVADALLPLVHEDELICRYSGSCFVLALNGNGQTESRLSLIVDAASQRQLEGSWTKPEFAGGVARFPQHASSAEELIQYASLASDSATAARGRGPLLFKPEMHDSLLRERELERELGLALRHRQLGLVYQPQIDLRTGEVVGVEALTRWHHPVRGAISPAQFIPLAERSELIDEIFLHSLRQLLADAAAWRQAGVVLPLLAVNASAANVRRADFVATVQRELEANPPIGSQLDLEVTESLMIDDEELFAERLRALRSIGVKVSLDDFGTRYTGFNALKGLPLNTMKIDQCFVRSVDHSTEAQYLCGTIVIMAGSLKLGTIAEGIESLGELRILQKIGCRAGQGYLFQRPVPAPQFLEFLEQWTARKTTSEFAGAFHQVERYLEDATGLAMALASALGCDPLIL